MNLAHALYEPPGDGPHPTLIVIHGWGANAFDLLGLAPFLGGGRFMVISPQGPLGLVMDNVLQGFGWFPLNGGGVTDPNDFRTAVDELTAFVDQALARYPIDRGKLALVGFSQGGVMAYALALRQRERFCAVAALSSWLPEQLVEGIGTASLSQLPVLVQHGTQDDLIDVRRARDSVERLRRLDASVIFREYDMGHQLNQQSIADLSQFLESKVLSPLILL